MSFMSLFFTPNLCNILKSEIATRAGAIREQLEDLDMRIIIENSLVEWNEL
jgi:DNA-directed RNA polymerase subunit beta'